MKRIFTITFYMLLTGFAFGQITITADEIPIPTDPFNMDDVTGFIPNPTPTADFTWDFGTIEGNSPFTITYYQETLKDFTDIGIDVFLPGFKSLTTQLGYNTDAELDFNDNAVEDKGAYVSYQVYPLGALTGNPKDSIYFPEQGWIWGSPKVIMEFPFTYQSTWSSISGRQTNFQISVAAAGLNKADATHIYYVVRKDTISGYGKLRLFTENGPSKYYDVLVDEITEFAVDSFYLGSTPAPTFLLTPFGMSQGQITDGRNRLNVYREGSYIYLFSTFYGPNDHGTTPLGEFINTDNLVVSTFDPTKEYSVLVYPNPCKGYDINLKVYGVVKELSEYKVLDIMGRTISTGTIANSTGIINISLPQNCVNGTYFVYLNDGSGKTVINEEFVVQH